MSLESEPQHKKLSPETYERVLGSVGEASKMTISERVNYVLKDEKCLESYKALGRTLANAGISALDLIPVAGDAVEAYVLGSKIAKKIPKEVTEKVIDYAKDTKKLKSDLGKKVDLTPDISTKEAIAIEAVTAPLELATEGALPSYLINTLWQLKADIKNRRFDGAVDAMKVLITGKKLSIDPKTKSQLDLAVKELKTL